MIKQSVHVCRAIMVLRRLVAENAPSILIALILKHVSMNAALILAAVRVDSMLNAKRFIIKRSVIVYHAIRAIRSFVARRSS